MRPIAVFAPTGCAPLAEMTIFPSCSFRLAALVVAFFDSGLRGLSLHAHVEWWWHD